MSKTATAEKKTVADRSMAKVPAKDRRAAFVRLLRKLDATSPTTARPISFLAEKLGYGKYDVYCLAYHKYPLTANGLLKTCQLEEHRDLCVYLTQKGQKIDVKEIP